MPIPPQSFSPTHTKLREALTKIQFAPTKAKKPFKEAKFGFPFPNVIPPN